jgi:hypothetical protein
MDLIEPVSFLFGVLVAITAVCSVHDLVFSKETENESSDEN